MTEVTWPLVLVLAVGAYLCKAIGLVVVGNRTLPASLERCLGLIPAALLSALIVSNTFADGQALVLDARAAGIAAASLAAWRKVPLGLVIVIGAAVTALVRLAA